MIGYIRNRRIPYAISLLIILAGVISLFISGLNLGIDFTGGTVFHINLAEEFTLAEVEELTGGIPELKGAALQLVQGRDLQGRVATEGVVIKSSYIDEQRRESIMEAFRERWPSLGPNDLRVESVGGVISGELARQSLIALAVAIAGMIAYITIRFEFKFALAAIIPLLHDIFVIVAVFSIFKIEANSPFIAALLTIFGYSVNNTIVIFDRIRENMKRKKKDEYAAVVDQSIRQSIVRTVNTSLTTLLTLSALLAGFYYFIGSFDLIAFVIALIIGVLVGTYSSLFIAGPLWWDLNELEFRRARRPA
ncbi:MAG TPA: protein translocase subunit SecF [Bacillota bacterium]|mgnify:FL=1|nr:protein translocase subunit SecF [Bacillota bacterium]HQE09519.1 protein translocase subunit SecF [Bacillota bacterium]